MKQKDIVLVVVMVFVGAVFALLVSRLVFSSPKNSKQTAEVVDMIRPEFSQPPSKYFNLQSVNATEHPVIQEQTTTEESAQGGTTVQP